MTSHNILICWSTGSKRSRKNPAQVTVKHHNGRFYSFIYESGIGWLAGFRFNEAPGELASPGLADKLFKALKTDDLYGSKLHIDENGLITDVSIY